MLGQNQPAKIRELPARFALRRCRDLMNTQVRAIEFFLGAQAYADQFFQHAVYSIAAGKSDHHTKQCAAQLRHEAHSADSAKRLEAEYPRR